MFLVNLKDLGGVYMNVLYKNLKVRLGLTLVELSIVMTIISIVALLALPRVSGIFERAKFTAAESDLRVIREAFVNQDRGFIEDLRGVPGFSVGFLRMANIFISTNYFGRTAEGDFTAASELTRWKERSEKGWRGPYIKAPLGTFPGRDEAPSFWPELVNIDLPEELCRRDRCSVYGFAGEPAMIDPWGRPYILQIPPIQAFENRQGVVTNVPDEVRFSFAWVVSAGPDGILDTPCYYVNVSNRWSTSWNESTRRLSRQAGRSGDDTSLRGDDLVMFLYRNDTEEGK